MTIVRSSGLSLSLGVFLVAGGAGLAYGQTPAAQSRPPVVAPTPGSYWIGPANQPTLADLTQKLNLSPQQQTEVRRVIDDRNARMACLTDTPVSTDLQRNVRTLDIEASVNEEMKELLTPAQQQQYARMVADEPSMAAGGEPPMLGNK